MSVEGSCFPEVEKNAEFVHICQNCLEKFLIALKTQTIPLLKWCRIYQAFRGYENLRLEDSRLWGVTLEESCIALVLKKEKHISDICEHCENFILNRTPQHVLFSTDVVFRC